MSFNDELVKIAEEWAEQEGAAAIDAEAAADFALQHRLYQLTAKNTTAPGGNTGGREYQRERENAGPTS